ncbi:MAG: hypothetical protein ABEJ64_00655 [Candidatus Nanohaloarchaea archaeon]
MRVLYVCTGNSFRSPVAEALTRKYHPDMEVESAGTGATDHVAENARELLEEVDALQYVKPSPDQLSQRAVDEADVVVTMMPGHRDFLEENFDMEGKDVRTWRVSDPVNRGVSPREAFEKLEQLVRSLPEP